MALAWHSTKGKSRTPVANANQQVRQRMARSHAFQENGDSTLRNPNALAGYWPEPVFDVVAVEGTAFGTLK